MLLSSETGHLLTAHPFVLLVSEFTLPNEPSYELLQLQFQQLGHPS